MENDTKEYMDHLYSRYVHLREELSRVVAKLDHVDEEDVALFQDICVLLSSQIKQVRSQCSSVYSVDLCREKLDRLNKGVEKD